ncbi:MAG: LysM peptidoglycan-binding domain-containing protein, partial [Caldilineaceae bacterium]|nr:LysM peptidoglycan-binding domain-containing protein [Caldilineaceae bacterium]
MNNQYQFRWRVASVAVVVAMVLTIVLAPGAVMAAPNAAATTSSSSYHVVRAGETLSGIAMMYGVPMIALMKANMISDPNKVYAGQRLMIPENDMGMGGWMEPEMPMGGMNDMPMGGMNDM